jgi:sulfite reductase (NADPH) hemoprotein beta-component
VAARAARAQVRGPGIVPERLVPMPTRGDGGEYPRFLRTNVRPQRQPGYVTVTAHVPMGDLTGAQFRLLADLARAYGDGAVRTTQQQNVVFRWVREADVPALWRRLRAAGLGRPDAATIADVTSCPGAESCKLAVTQSRGLGRELVEFLASRPDLVAIAPGASIKISGCPNGCSQHHIATFGFQGAVRRLGDRVAPQYHLLLGGDLTADGAVFGRRAAKIPARRVTRALERMLLHYRDHHRDGESAAQYFRRLEPAALDALLKDLCEMTAADARPEDYVDIGEDHAYRVETQEGECAA